MNNIILIGRIVKDIELKYTTGENSVAVCNFSLAVQRDKDTADFIPCVAWGKTAEILTEYAGKKGTQVGLTGELQSRNYETENGKRYVIEVKVNKVHLI